MSTTIRSIYLKDITDQIDEMQRLINLLRNKVEEEATYALKHFYYEDRAQLSQSYLKTAVRQLQEAANEVDILSTLLLAYSELEVV
jgi:hypothetical protein